MINPLRALLARFRKRRKIIVIRRDETKLSLSEWRGDRELVSIASRIWSNPDFRLMFSVLKNENPAFTVLSNDAPATSSIAVQRRTEGYVMALANLEAMARYEQEPEQIEATFEPEEDPGKVLV